MAYKVVKPFRDRHLNQSFDTGFYPHTDRRIPDGWVEKLMSGDNAVGEVFLEEVADTPAPVETPPEDPIDRAALEAEATALGIQFSPNIGDKKLAERVAEAKEQK